MHALSIMKDVSYGVVHGVVEEASYILLERSNVGRVSIEALSKAENTCRLGELRPELLFDLRDSIDSDTIKVVFLNQLLNPLLQVVSNVRVILIEIGKSGETTILNFLLISPVVNLTLVVVVLSLVQWVYL